MSAPVLPVASLRRVGTHCATLVRGNRPALLLTFVVLTAAAFAGLVTPWALGRVVDLVEDDTATGADLAWLGGSMAAAVLAAAALGAVGFVLSARLLETMIARLREQMLDVGLSLPLARIEETSSGDLVSRATDDVSAVSSAVNETLPAITGALFTIGATFVLLGAMDWRFALALATILPFHAFAVWRYSRTAPAIYAAERRAMGVRAQRVLTAIHGVDTVHAYQSGPARVEDIARSSWAVVQLSISARLVINRFFARLNLAELVGMTALLVVGFTLVDAGAATVGATTAAMLLFHRLFGPIGQLLLVIDTVQSGVASLQRIVGVIDEQPAAVPMSPPAPDAAADSRLEIRGVSHSYSADHPVLRDVDLTIEPGQKLALVGESGAGKSTLAALVAGVRTPSAGSITLGGAILGPQSAGRTVALVTQETHVFAGPLREDVRLVAPSASDDEILDAFETVGATDWLRALPDGLDTIVGAHGHRLTPAQVQHLALARIVLLDPPLVLLDEATAEAGSAGARQLDDGARAALAGRTSLVIAHRLSQAADADVVAVVADGRIVETGSHEALVAAGGKYAQLWANWTAGREI
ncbi:ABC transporter ATP-binding protein [Tomitella biformata]|uniref:ABC transporter ATP-binding protein n=1 Tax=Tomitella biformata TaxID=630403 RepID=UPI000466EBB1|nr:ABC transporter ATP-binding protein [Tomitella biformata]